MTEDQQRPFARRVQASAMRLVNIPMRVILGLRVATPLSKRLMLAFIIDRKTGKIYRQPISYVKDGDTLPTPGGGKWKLNLRDGRAVRLRLRGRDVLARPELVAEAEEVDRLLSIILAANPRARSFVRIPMDANGHLNREKLQTAVKFGFRIVRWHLSEP